MSVLGSLRFIAPCIAVLLSSWLPAFAVANTLIPAIEDVPDALRDPPRSSLVQRQVALLARRADLLPRIKDRDARCQLYSSKSKEAFECPELTARIQQQKSAYIASVNKFNWDVDQAIAQYQNELERRLGLLDNGLALDARSIQKLGFSKRASDFAEWATLSEDAHRKLVLNAMDNIVNGGGAWIAGRLTSRLQSLGIGAGTLNPSEARLLLREYDASNVLNSKAREYLRTIATSATPGETGELARLIHEDLMSARDAYVTAQDQSHFEAMLKMLETVAPPHIRFAADGAELLVWAAYDFSAQWIATERIQAYMQLTDEQLRALSSIACVSQRRVAEQYEIKKTLAALNGKPFDRARPIVAGHCTGQSRASH